MPKAITHAHATITYARMNALKHGTMYIVTSYKAEFAHEFNSNANTTRRDATYEMTNNISYVM